MSNTILIDGSNVRTIISYVENLKKLKKVIKEEFNKEGRSEMGIAEKIPLMTQEVEKFEKLLNDYFWRTADVIKKGGCYIYEEKKYGDSKELEIFRIDNRDNKKYNITCIRIYLSLSSNYNHHAVTFSKTSRLVRSTVDDYYNGKLKEISTEEFEDILQKYNTNQETVKSIVDKYANK